MRADQQSRIDALLGTTASLAPGPLNTARDDFEARIDVARPTQWRFRAGYQGFHDVGTGAGIGLALDPDGRLNVDLFNTDFTYRPPLPKPWEGDIQASYLRTVTKGDVTTLPSGTLRGLFPVGIRNAFTYDVNQFRLDATVRHEGFFGHQLSFGAGVHRSENATEEKVNYLVTPAGILPAGRFANTRDLGIDKALPDSERTNIYAFVQDQWHLAPDWHLTAGLRVDRYSDFGTAVNPRLALVWNAAPDLIFKALYGRAFRAPSFFDLYGNSPFILVGDRGIKPEKLDMLELVAFKSWVPYPLSTTLNIFGYETRDLIAIEPTDPLAFASPSNNRNIDGTRGHGLEFELRYDPVPDIRLKLNYAFQHQDEGTSLMGRIAPEQQFYGEINWRFRPHWQLNTRAKWIVDPSGYAFVDLTLRNTEAAGADRWDVTLGVNNLFDTDAHEATLFTRALPEGVPLPGRNVTAQIRYRF
ncbi:MAG TPA: TonB-dependent receptor [Candidatus Competibacter sp.]|nr:hypothetical protein [Candidatus Competibacteraceae bacterium]HRC73868.1 TonB-dependent receptor [Candidatus Competibacter sp.]